MYSHMYIYIYMCVHIEYNLTLKKQSFSLGRPKKLRLRRNLRMCLLRQRIDSRVNHRRPTSWFILLPVVVTTLDKG